MRLALAVLSLAVAAVGLPARGAALLHQFRTVVMAPDGRHVAAIESDDVETDTAAPLSLVIHGLDGRAMRVALPCVAGPNCKVASPSWSGDGRWLAFLIDHDRDNTAEIEEVDASGGAPRRLLGFDGPLDGLRYGPADRLAVLATANAHKHVGRTEAAAALTGEIGGAVDEQRVAVLEPGQVGQAATLRFVSPADLYVYEFDWRPDGGFVGTAAHGDGDANWWVARLYAFDDGAARLLFAPSPREQLASPVVSPDGSAVAFVGGWMSDFGSTGGDAYTLPLRGGGVPTDLTSGSHATITALDWHCGDGLTGMALAGDTLSVRRLDQVGATAVWTGQQTLSAGGELSLSCSRRGVAAVAERFTEPPEIVAGPLGGRWRAITHSNARLPRPALSARSVSWTSDGQAVQGWLLTPEGGRPTMRRPMVVLVHGGPEAAATPSYPSAHGVLRGLLAQGWDVFEPNYRGSYGQGEAFAAASIQDLGGGDWRDVLSGVDTAEHAAPIDDAKLGIMGGSYGGYMTMWAVTQTHRFRAGVAAAGVSDWLSLEGEAPQAGSDEVNFGGSVYDNPAPYLRASPITHMRGVTTPVLIVVGERDVECPLPQSLEYYTAMKAIGAATEFVVYAGEGHALKRQADREDERRRTIGWFRRWFGGSDGKAK